MAISSSIVRKSNALIEASYNLTIFEHRILLACISQLTPNKIITDEILYSVSATDIADLSQTSPKQAYRELQKAALRLKRSEVRLFNGPNGLPLGKKVMVASIVQTLFYVEEEGRIELRFNKDILPYLTQLSREYTQYALKNVAKISSSYALRLYELLVQWKNIGQKDICMDSLRKTLCAEGKYKANNDFKKWVIEPALKQINSLSDLSVLTRYKKTGRRITHATFSFKLKNPSKQENKHSFLTKSQIEQNAKPGESWAEAKKRLSRKKEGDPERCPNTVEMFDLETED